MTRNKKLALDEVLECGICRFTYLNNSNQLGLHARLHNQVVNGLRWPKLTSEKEVFHQDNERIIQVDSSSALSQHLRAIKLAQLANLETQYDFGMYTIGWRYLPSTPNIFVVIKDERAIALLIVSQLKPTFRHNWKTQKRDPINRASTTWTVNYLWVLKKYRDGELGVQLFRIMSKCLRVRPLAIAWDYPLTPMEELVARKVSRETLLMVHGWG